jgi:hypothetical protein
VINWEETDELLGNIEVMSPKKLRATDPLIKEAESFKRFNVTVAEPPLIWPKDAYVNNFVVLHATETPLVVPIRPTG